MAATWLATKLEETPRQAKDLLRVFARIDARAQGASLDVIDPYSQVTQRPSSLARMPSAILLQPGL